MVTDLYTELLRECTSVRLCEADNTCSYEIQSIFPLDIAHSLLCSFIEVDLSLLYMEVYAWCNLEDRPCLEDDELAPQFCKDGGTWPVEHYWEIFRSCLIQGLWPHHYVLTSFPDPKEQIPLAWTKLFTFYRTLTSIISACMGEITHSQSLSKVIVSVIMAILHLDLRRLHSW